VSPRKPRDYKVSITSNLGGPGASSIGHKSKLSRKNAKEELACSFEPGL
jgi:hypothetical protein